MKKITTFLFLAFVLLSCSKSGEDLPNGGEDNRIVKSVITGKIEKGPFLTGSKVSLYELDKELKQTGKNIFKTETTSDNGDFVFDSKMELLSQYVELEISGYFFNEVTKTRSSSQITLNALADVSGKNKINVNILTHLVYKRIKNLVAGGLNFSAAQKQAHKEILNIFHITKEVKNSDDIGLTDGNDDAAILLAISSILLYQKSEAEFSEFIAMLSNDFASDGLITNNDLLEKIHQAQKNVNSLDVMNNLKSYFEGQSKTIVIENIRKYIDGNGDGILDANDETYEIKPPVDLILEDNVFQNEQVYGQALSASYVKVCSYFEYILVLDAVRCNQINYKSNIDAGNSILKNAWSQAYQAINSLNLIITNSEKDANSYAKPYLYTSLVLRTMLYLDMIQHWGDVPFITKQLSMEDMYVPRKNKLEVLDSLLTDLNESVPFLKEETDLNQMFVSKDLANSLIGTIHLERKDYSTAAIYFEKIVNKGLPLSINNTVYTDIRNKETFFSLVFSNDINQIPFDIYSQFLKKGNLHPIYRNTGVLLSYAEANLGANKKTEMLNVLNRIRTAANMSTLQESPLKPESEIADLWNKVIDADYGYFALLKRLGIAVELLAIQNYQQLYPLPQSELIMNPNLIQNPGY